MHNCRENNPVSRIFAYSMVKKIYLLYYDTGITSKRKKPGEIPSFKNFWIFNCKKKYFFCSCKWYNLMFQGWTVFNLIWNISNSDVLGHNPNQTIQKNIAFDFGLHEKQFLSSEYCKVLIFFVLNRPTMDINKFHEYSRIPSFINKERVRNWNNFQASMMLEYSIVKKKCFTAC